MGFDILDNVFAGGNLLSLISNICPNKTPPFLQYPFNLEAPYFIISSKRKRLTLSAELCSNTTLRFPFVICPDNDYSEVAFELIDGKKKNKKTMRSFLKENGRNGLQHLY